MSLVSSREKRSTAGNRMSKLLDQEDDDDFYKTTYGGFNEVHLTKIKVVYSILLSRLVYTIDVHLAEIKCFI